MVSWRHPRAANSRPGPATLAARTNWDEPPSLHTLHDRAGSLGARLSPGSVTDSTAAGETLYRDADQMLGVSGQCALDALAGD